MDVWTTFGRRCTDVAYPLGWNIEDIECRTDCHSHLRHQEKHRNACGEGRDATYWLATSGGRLHLAQAITHVLHHKFGYFVKATKETPSKKD